MGIKSVIVDGEEVLKLMVDGKVAWERCVLPAGYQKCAFIQSDGNQYLSIDDYIPQIGDSFSIDFVVNSNNGAVFSAGTGDYQFIAMLDKMEYIYIKYFTTGIASSINISTIEAPYSLRFLSDGKILFDRTEIDTEVSKVKGAVNTNLYLYIRANLTSGFDGKIFGFKAERNGNVIRNLIPALRSGDGKPGMFDTVSKNFYVNQGTGEFLYELV